MTDKTKEALKLALEAMTYADACLKKQLTTKDKHEYAQDLLLEAGTAIREALALVNEVDQEQPAQHQCKFPLCQNEEYQQALAEQLKRELYTGEPAQPQQEPVAWSYWQSCLNDDGTQTAPWVHRLSKFQPSESVINKDITPLYTAPPAQRTWVGLTDDEIDQGLLRSDYALKTAEAWRAGVVFAMTKLKEKNT